MQLFRAASMNHQIFSGYGAFLKGARWNPQGYMVIYCAYVLAVCRLELMAHIGRANMPLNYGFVVVEVPNSVSREIIQPNQLPIGWDDLYNFVISQAIGRRWLDERRTCLLQVPSVAAQNDHVVLVNPLHQDFQNLIASDPQPMKWDGRHFE